MARQHASWRQACWIQFPSHPQELQSFAFLSLDRQIPLRPRSILLILLMSTSALGARAAPVQGSRRRQADGCPLSAMATLVGAARRQPASASLCRSAAVAQNASIREPCAVLFDTRVVPLVSHRGLRHRHSSVGWPWPARATCACAAGALQAGRDSGGVSGGAGVAGRRRVAAARGPRRVHGGVCG
jgi:hypothetical protein